MRGRRPAPVCIIVLCACAALWNGCTTAPRYTRSGSRLSAGPPPRQSPAARGRTRMSGMASYYGLGFHGKKTASGERFNMYKLTAAHKSLPFGTRVRVTNLDNNKSVIVRINDRGPYAKGRIIDLSLAAARDIGMVKSGTARVRLEIIGR